MFDRKMSNLLPYWQTTDERYVRLYHGHATTVLRRLPSRSVQCIVTSPPYWQLRQYNAGPDELGQESSPQEYVSNLVEVFTECQRVLRGDGTLWVNIGDTFGPKPGHKRPGLVGIPHRLRFAMEDAGWITAMEHIWHKPDPMPSSVEKRCTMAHEFVYLFTQITDYYYDRWAIKEPNKTVDKGDYRSTLNTAGTSSLQLSGRGGVYGDGGANKRSVWTLSAGSNYSGGHFATFPPKLVEPCILAGTSERGCCALCGASYARVVEKTQLVRDRPRDYVKRQGEAGTGNVCANSVAGVDVRTVGWKKECSCPGAATRPCVVLDPFIGSGTTAVVCVSLADKGRRDCWGIELKEEYLRNNAVPRVEGYLMERPALAGLISRRGN